MLRYIFIHLIVVIWLQTWAFDARSLWISKSTSTSPLLNLISLSMLRFAQKKDHRAESQAIVRLNKACKLNWRVFYNWVINWMNSALSCFFLLHFLLSLMLITSQTTELSKAYWSHPTRDSLEKLSKKRNWRLNWERERWDEMKIKINVIRHAFFRLWIWSFFSPFDVVGNRASVAIK